MDADVSGLLAWEAQLEQAAADAPKEGKKVVSRGCLNIKRDWRQRWSGLGHAPDLPKAVTYDVHAAGGAITGEVGPDKNRRQGGLGNIIEFGTPENNAPIPGGAPALEAEEPRFERAVAELGERLLGE